MLVEALPELYFDDAGGVVANHLLHVLQDAPQHNQAGHRYQGGYKGGEAPGVFVNDLDDYHGGNRQAGHTGCDCQQSNKGREKDSETHALRQREKTGIKVHLRLPQRKGLQGRASNSSDFS
jgi:hypothetical protein